MSALQPRAAMGQGPSVAELRVSILHLPDCPLVGKVRARVEAALEDANSPAFIVEVEGLYSSPTLLIDGVALPGFPLDVYAACRIDFPTQQQIASAILAASTEGPIV
jgi:hypothetical protein